MTAPTLSSLQHWPRELEPALKPLGSLGAGAQSWVYLALRRDDERPVAVKVSRHDPEDDWTQRFLREAEILAGLRHPGVIRVLGYGHLEDRRPFMIMEYVEGKELKKLIPLQFPWPVMRQVASALDAIHGAGILHRDLKPANILVTREGRAVLADFGLALDPTRTTLTRTGAVVGTLSYLAPEIMRTREATLATEWYSFGACLYEAVEGKRLFRASDVWAFLESGEALPIPRFSRTDPAAPLARLARALLHRDPDRRPQGVVAIEAYLEACGASVPSPAPQEPDPSADDAPTLPDLFDSQGESPVSVGPTRPELFEEPGDEDALPALEALFESAEGEPDLEDLFGSASRALEGFSSRDPAPETPRAAEPATRTAGSRAPKPAPRPEPEERDPLAVTDPSPHLHRRPTAPTMLKSDTIRPPTAITRRPPRERQLDPESWLTPRGLGQLLGASVGGFLLAFLLARYVAWGHLGAPPSVVTGSAPSRLEEATARLAAAAEALRSDHAGKPRGHRLGHHSQERSEEDLEHVATTRIHLLPEHAAAWDELLAATEAWAQAASQGRGPGLGRAECRPALERHVFGTLRHLMEDVRLQFLRLRAGGHLTGEQLTRLEGARRRGRELLQHLEAQAGGRLPPLLRPLNGYAAAYLGGGAGEVRAILGRLLGDLRLEARSGEERRIDAVLSLLAAWPELADFPPPARAEVLDQLASRVRRRAGWYAPETRRLLLARLVLEEVRLSRLAPDLAPRRAEAISQLLLNLGPRPPGRGPARDTLAAALRLGLLAKSAPYRKVSPDLRRALVAAAKLAGRRVGSG